MYFFYKSNMFYMGEYFFRFLSELLSFNFTWIIDAALLNLQWVFVFALFAFFLIGEKNLLKNTFFVFFYLFAFTSIILFIGWSFGALYLFCNFILQCFIRIFIPNSKYFYQILASSIYCLIGFLSLGGFL